MLSKTQWWIIGGVSALVVGVITILVIKGRKKSTNNLNISKNSKTLVCSHIGQIENGSRAENNLENIKKLIDSNIDMVEIDIQITKDNVGVLFHDNSLDEKTNGTGTIQSKLPFLDLFIFNSSISSVSLLLQSNVFFSSIH